MKTAWFDEEKIVESMNNSGFKPLRESDHFPSLRECFNKVKGKTLFDLGCGAGEAFSAFKNFDYTGADLPHVIDNVARSKNKDGNFLHFDANEGDYSILKEFDVVLMNSFLSEIPDWYRILSNVLLNAEKFVILHRQEVTDKETRLETYPTYGGLLTTKTVINYEILTRIFELNEFNIIHEVNSFKNTDSQKTFLISK